ncbi:MAG: energy-coupling factor transporter transmembrane protein EcfT [Deltaproteobacteria bacterium]|nr:energy-coupling factor transporter transmembrane protein EcfT [Deltaproteobacteria bacterium]
MNDPRGRVLLVALVGVLAVCLDRPASLALLLLASAAPVLGRPPAPRELAQGVMLALGIAWSTVLSQGLFYSEQPRVAFFTLGPITLWREGAVHGLVQSLRFLAVTTAGVSLARSTPADRLYLGLLGLRVPFGVAFLVATALRFVPEAAREWATVRQARARRGRPVYRRAPWAWLALEAAMLAPVLARSLRRARALAESLDARGFDPAVPRRPREALRMRPLEVIGLVLAGTGVAAVAAARVLFLLYASGTWYHPALRPLYAAVRAYL